MEPAPASKLERTADRSPLAEWTPEDADFWQRIGRRIAFRNLAISIPCLLCGFAVWMMWSVITVKMQDLGFPFSKAQLYTLTAVAGLAGATMRISNSFLVAVVGGRNVVATTTALLLIPTLGAGIALRDPDTPYATFVVLAALSGIGGGAFSSSMSSISQFFPKRMQGLALGLNAGVGNLGVSALQLLAPVLAGVALFGGLGGEPQALPDSLGGGDLWLQNCGLMSVPLLAVLVVAAWFGMTNLPMHKVGPAPLAIARMLWLLLLAVAATAAGAYALIGLGWSKSIVLPSTIVLALALMRGLSPAPVRANLGRQFVIFRHKHTWLMTWLYIMTFGSFIGFSAVFPKLIQDLFATLPDGTPDPSGPSALSYAWLGPLVGSLARPLGGWLSDKIGGARVTHWSTVVLVAATIGVGWLVQEAGTAEAPADYFAPFLALFLVLFVCTGIGNGSTFRMIPVIFEPTLAGPVLGWTGAVAAYGSFIVPTLFSDQLRAGTPEYAFYGFAAYYLSCLVVNWWYYHRKAAEVPC